MILMDTEKSQSIDSWLGDVMGKLSRQSGILFFMDYG